MLTTYKFQPSLGLGWGGVGDDWIKCNVDRLCLWGQAKIGWGGIFHDFSGAWLYGFIGNLGSTYVNVLI